MKRVLIYTDCNLFGGSEHAIINLLKNNELKKQVQFTFAYRYHRTYKDKISELLAAEEELSIIPIRLLTNYGISGLLKKLFHIKILYRISFAFFFYCEKVGIYNIINRFRIKNFLRKHHYDIVHVNNGGYPGARSCLIMAEESAKYHSKVILQVNNIANGTMKKSVNESVVKSVDFFITASQIAKSALKDVLSISQDCKILTIPHFVDHVQPKKSRSEVLSFCNIREDSMLIVEVALLQQRKGQVELVKAIPNLLKIIDKDIHVVLIGNGEYEGRIIDAIKEHNLESNIHMLGYRDDYIDFLNAADVVALPSLKDEDMPLTIISALSLGKPVVSTRLAGIPEEIEDGVSGVLIEPQSESFIQDLTNAIYKAYNEKGMLSVNAKKRYMAMFSKEKFTESYLNLYSSL